MVKIWKLVLAVLVVLCALKVAFFNINENNYYWDEAVYMDIAQNVREHNSYFSSMDENFRAPLFPMLLSFFPAMSMAHLFVILLSLLSVYFAYLLGREVSSKSTGLMAALFLAINPLYYFWSYKLLTEPLTLCLILLSLYFFIKFEKGGLPNFYLYASFFIAGLAVLARYTSLSLVAALGLAVLIKGKAFRKEYWIAGIIFLTALLPLFLLGIKFYGNPIGMPLQNSLVTSYPEMPISTYLQNILYSLGFFTPLLFIFSLFTKARRKVPSVLWLYLIFTTALLCIVNQKYDRFLIILLPAYAIVSAIGFVCIYKQIGKLKVLLVLATVILSSLVVSTNVGIIIAEKHNTEILLDATNFVKDLPCDTVISDSTKHFTLFSDKNVMSYPATRQEFLSLIDEKNAGCFVIDSFHGLPDYRKFINDTYKLIYANSSGDKFIYVYSQ